MRRILVTGGFGFIGTYLVQALHRDPGAAIHVVDNLSSNPLPLEYVFKEFGPMPRLTYDSVSVQEFCAKATGDRFDEVYHLASVVGPAGVIPHMGGIVKSIVDDLYALMALTSRAGAKLVDVSTSEVYGGGQQGLCSEEMPKIIAPRSSARLEYAVGKLAGEVALINTCMVTGLQACIVRPFNISGPRQSARGGFVLPRFVAQAIHGHDVTVFGDGKQVRAFTHVKDIVSGIVAAMQHGRAGEAYNLGNPDNKCTIEDLATDTIKITESRSRIIHIDPKTIYGALYEEANDKFPDASKSMAELNWRPAYDRLTIIRETVDYFRRLPDDVFAHLAPGA